MVLATDPPSLPEFGLAFGWSDCAVQVVEAPAVGLPNFVQVRSPSVSPLPGVRELHAQRSDREH